MKIRTGNIDDLEALQQLFRGTVASVCSADYDEKQIEMWLLGAEKKQRWQEMLQNQFVLIAQENKKITGFCTLENGNYIDFLYIHKDYQKQGIAYKLYTAIEQKAKQQGHQKLSADVSKTAKKFFERMGFSVIKEQIVVINNVALVNYKMMKTIILNMDFLQHL